MLIITLCVSFNGDGFASHSKIQDLMQSSNLTHFCFALFLCIQQGATNDLIELDTSLSFELDDFDPLKPNAKQLPMLKSKAQSTFYTSAVTSTPTSVAAAVANPVYTFYTPNNITATPSPSTTNNASTGGKLSQFDEDDLLRNFGLHNLIGSNRDGYRGEHTIPNQSANKFDLLQIVTK